MKRIYYLGRPEDGFGWGVANTNLIRSLSEFCEVVPAPRDRKYFNAPIFVPIASHDLKADVRWKAPRILGYCFTEWPVPDDARRNARAYDVVFAGSNWCAQRLRDAGVRNVEVLLQGIDFERFKPQPLVNRKAFTIFSGGKYEFRKGQDYVLAACKLFMKIRPDVVLLAAWHNQWAESMRSMELSWLIDPADPFKELPRERVIRVPAVRNEQTPAIYAQADVGVFPNRCEAGTNLVMCEFMACQRPVVASYATGHKDVFDHGTTDKEVSDKVSDKVLERQGPWLLANGSYDPAGWFNPNVSDIIAALEEAYTRRDQLPERGLACRQLVQRFSWRDCAERIFRAAFPAG